MSKHTITLSDGKERALFFSLQSLAEISNLVGGVDKFGDIQEKFKTNPAILGSLVYEGLYGPDGTEPDIPKEKIARMIQFDQVGKVMSAFFEAIGAKNDESDPSPKVVEIAPPTTA